MDKNFTEVTIAGKTYTLGGYEDEEYIQVVAGYINKKINELKKTDGYMRQNEDFKEVMLWINLADDYFKERSKAGELKKKNEELEKEIYTLKHELATTKARYDYN